MGDCLMQLALGLPPDLPPSALGQGTSSGSAACPDSIQGLLALTRKYPGWHLIPLPPQAAVLDGGCALYVVPPVLWAGRRKKCWRTVGTVVLVDDWRGAA